MVHNTHSRTSRLVGLFNRRSGLGLIVALLLVLLLQPNALAQTQTKVSEEQWRKMAGIPLAMPLPSDTPSYVERAAKSDQPNLQSVAPGGGNAGNFASNLLFANADGTGQQLVTESTNFAASYYNPVVSPDGSTVLMGRNDGFIVLFNADGSNERILTTGYSASWSPDGQQVYFNALVGGTNEIFRIGVDGQGRTQISTGTYSKYNPVVKNGKIAFTWQTLGGYTDLYVMDLDGTNATAWTHDAYVAYPGWTAIGHIVATMSIFDSMGSSSRIVDFAGVVQWTPITAGRYDYQPMPLDDGSILYVTQSGGTRSTIMHMGADGSNPTRLLFGNSADMTPDGKTLVFADQVYDSQLDWGGTILGLSGNNGGSVTITGRGVADTFVIKMEVSKPDAFVAIGINIIEPVLEDDSAIELLSVSPATQDGKATWISPAAGIYTATFKIVDIDRMYVEPRVWAQKGSEQPEQFMFQLARLNHLVQGMVTDSAGHPIGGAKISLHGRNYDETLYSDLDGSFKQRWLVNGDYDVFVSHPHYTFDRPQERVFIDLNSWPRDKWISYRANNSMPAQQWLQFDAGEYDAPVGASEFTLTNIYSGTSDVTFDIEMYAVGNVRTAAEALAKFHQQKALRTQGVSDFGPYATITRTITQSGSLTTTVPLPKLAYRAGDFVIAEIMNIKGFGVWVGPLYPAAVINLHQPVREVNFSAGSFLRNGNTVSAQLELNWPYTSTLNVKVLAVQTSQTAQLQATASATGIATFEPGQTTANVVVDVSSFSGPVKLIITAGSAQPGVLNIGSQQPEATVSTSITYIYLPLAARP